MKYLLYLVIRRCLGQEQTASCFQFDFFSPCCSANIAMIRAIETYLKDGSFFLSLSVISYEPGPTPFKSLIGRGTLATTHQYSNHDQNVILFQVNSDLRIDKSLNS